MPDDNKKKPSAEINNLKSQADELLKAFESAEEPSDSPSETASIGSTSDTAPTKPEADESLPSGLAEVRKAKLVSDTQGGPKVWIPVGFFLFLFCLIALIGNQYEISSRREQAKLAELQAQRDKAASLLAKEKEAREKADRELALERELRRKEKEELQLVERNLEVRRESLKSAGWAEVGGSGLLYRFCNPSQNRSRLGKPCASPTGEFKWWAGYELYCLSETCSGRSVISMHPEEKFPEEFISSFITLRPGEKHEFIVTTKKDYDKNTLIQAAGLCRTQWDSPWKKC